MSGQLLVILSRVVLQAQAATCYELAAHVLQSLAPRCLAVPVRLILAGLQVVHAAHLC